MTRNLSAMACVEMRTPSTDELRREALQRLYRRRDVVDELIQTLELYEQERNPKLAACIPISAGRGWLS